MKTLGIVIATIGGGVIGWYGGAPGVVGEILLIVGLTMLGN